MNTPIRAGYFALLAAIACTAAANTASAAIIYQENFSGGNTGLNNTAPDVRPEGSTATWQAGSDFRENGAFTGSSTVGQSAWLPYDIQSGQIYEAAITFSLVPNSGNSRWIGLSFTNHADPFATTALNISDQSGPSAMGWAILRQNGNWAAFRGPGADVSIGSSSNAPYAGALANATIRLQLDTRGANYVLSAFINNIQLDLAGTGLSYTFTSPQQFTGVGLGFSYMDIGTVQQFTFSTIPEPSALLLLGMGGLGLLAFARRKVRA